MALFTERGFAETTVDDIAEALGIGRRTLFHYFPSKNDIVWGNFDGVLDHLRAEFAVRSDEVPMMTALREAVLASNTYPEAALPELRVRMTLITTVPTLQAHSMLRYADWRSVVAEFAAGRLRRPSGEFAPRALGYAALAASTAAFTQWVGDPGADLLALLDRSYRMLEAGFDPDAL
jgi:mycofactocin system transcriptional regulator